MNLQTKIVLPKEVRNPISYPSKILLLGSCFSKNIGEKLEYFKFQTIQNPFGILFHPKAIEKCIVNAIQQKTYTAEELVFQNDRWHCLDAHSSLSSVDKEKLLNQLNTVIATTNTALKEANHLIITLGTAWIYRHTETNTIVANCHKIPQKKFSKELLSVTEIRQSLTKLIAEIRLVNPNLQILFTVSPVRHLKDGFIENTQSKSHLITAIHKVLHEETLSKESNKKGGIGYFPSFEIMMDELRDYRFYEADMIHPNTTAIEYIWERFSATWIADNATETMQKVDQIQKGLSHRPFYAESEQHQKFEQNLSDKIVQLTHEFSFMKFEQKAP
jgi:hypothetical protein